jgi:tRNA uridine 5-carboxymethylaminomethyl modification enzyme
MFIAGKYDVVVIGAGHAGIEAVLASSRLGCHTGMFTINFESIANLPCNPSIGGTAKGHLVREIDALGGEMGKIADATMLQFRMLGLSKGAAVHSPRGQVDRKMYQLKMKHVLEKQENLELKQAEIVDIELNPDNSVNAVITATGAKYLCKAVVISSGTYLRSRIIIGDFMKESGPDGVFPATELSKNIKKLGIKLGRLKTGTPPRINKRSINLAALGVQYGDNIIVPFSFQTTARLQNKLECYIVHTNAKTHEIIRKNIDKSPVYSGKIEGIGPRYCPSIEDKIVRFADKPSHQLFVEPTGEESEEMYLQGFSTSMPEDVQIAMVRSLVGFEHAEIMRPAYAIEYDFSDPTQLRPTLEFKNFPGIYGAGQFNGTSGYEEAAAQGIIAGINAARKILKKPEFTLDRSDAYIGILIDDLVTKGTKEPYRMMTSRAEYRLLLRQDNADLRLTEKGHNIGLIPNSAYEKFLSKKEKIEAEIGRLKKTFYPPSKKLATLFDETGSEKNLDGIKASELLKRPEISYKNLAKIDENMPNLNYDVRNEVEISIKYEGYINRQERQIKEFKKLENKKLSQTLDYSQILGLRLEARQKLNNIKPESIGQASRISGVSPADIMTLLIYLNKK